VDSNLRLTLNNMLCIHGYREMAQIRQRAKYGGGSVPVLRGDIAIGLQYGDICTSICRDLGDEIGVIISLKDLDIEAMLTEEQTANFAAEVAVDQGKVAKAFDVGWCVFGGHVSSWYSPGRHSIGNNDSVFLDQNIAVYFISNLTG
jgi:hypothetical protein